MHGTALLSACAVGNYQIVKLLIEKGADLAVADVGDNNALHLACRGKGECLEIAKLLHERNRDLLKAVNDQGRAPLLVACSTGSTEIVKFLLEKGASHTVHDFENHTALNLACWGKGGTLQIVETLLQLPEIPLDIPTSGGRTALLSACTVGNHQVAKLLIEKGANCNVADGFNGDTALHLACWGGKSLEIVKLLHGINKTLLEVVNKEGRTPLLVASHAGCTEIVDFLLEEGADPTIIDHDGHTALHLASWGNGGTLPIVQTLLRLPGAALDFPTVKGRTALLSACAVGHYQIVKLLLENNADWSLVDRYDGDTALHLACHGKEGCLDIVKLLHQKDQGLRKILNSHGRTPLLCASPCRTR